MFNSQPIIPNIAFWIPKIYFNAIDNYSLRLVDKLYIINIAQ